MITSCEVAPSSSSYSSHNAWPSNLADYTIEPSWFAASPSTSPVAVYTQWHVSFSPLALPSSPFNGCTMEVRFSRLIASYRSVGYHFPSTPYSLRLHSSCKPAEVPLSQSHSFLPLGMPDMTCQLGLRPHPLLTLPADLYSSQISFDNAL